jgi:hypothetical protein
MDFWASRKGLKLFSSISLLGSIIFTVRPHRWHPSPHLQEISPTCQRVNRVKGIAVSKILLDRDHRYMIQGFPI